MMKLPASLPALLFALLATAHCTRAQTFSAGSGAVDIQVSDAMLPVEGYTVVHDPISARVLLLEQGGLRVAILVVDTPSIQDSFIASWKKILVKATEVKVENTLVIASHDTSAPHVSDGTGPGAGVGSGKPPSPASIANAKAYAQAVNTAVERAASKALATLRPAQVGFGLGTSRVNVNRDVLTPRGWGLGYNDAGFTDPSLAVIRIDVANGKPLAWLVDYAVRPAVMERSADAKEGQAISGDLVGAVEHYVESHSDPGGMAMFLMGAGVDQSPYLMANRLVLDKAGNSTRMDIHEAGFVLVDLLGERLGAEAVRVSDAMKLSPASLLRIVRQSVEVPSQTPILPSGSAAPGPPVGATVKIPYVLLQIGEIVFVGIAPELNADIGVKIKAESPFAHTIVVTMVDGSAKYLPNLVNYDRKSPEALGSRYGRGSAEATVEQIIASLKQLKMASQSGK